MSGDFNWPIFGHKKQQDFLQTAIAQDRLAHTYIFYGPAGLGKKMIANYFAQSIFCQDKTARPCQKCLTCQQTKKGIFPDRYELGKNGQELSVDNVRSLIYSLSLSAVYGGHRLAIIYGMDNINLQGANALLKTLEEPGANTVIILVSDFLARLPATLISRCQLLKFQPLAQEDMGAWLDTFDFSPAERETVNNLSFGRPGLALNIMQDKLGNFKKSCNFMIKLLSGGTFYFMQALDLWFEVLKKEHPEYKVYELGALTKKYLDLLEVFLRDILWLQLDRPIINKLYQQEIASLASRFPKENLLKNILSLNSWKEKLKYNVSPQLLWENLFLSLK